MSFSSTRLIISNKCTILMSHRFALSAFYSEASNLTSNQSLSSTTVFIRMTSKSVLSCMYVGRLALQNYNCHKFFSLTFWNLIKPLTEHHKGSDDADAYDRRSFGEAFALPFITYSDHEIFGLKSSCFTA